MHASAIFNYTIAAINALMSLLGGAIGLYTLKKRSQRDEEHGND